MSHEASELRETLLHEFGDYWTSWNTDYDLGIPQIQQWLTLTEATEPHPFHDGLMGRPRIFAVAPDDEYEFVYDRKHARYFVTPSKSERGYKRLRQEMASYHYPPEEMGKPVQKMRPRKILDDVIDTLRAFATHWGPTVEHMTDTERRVNRIPNHLKPAVVMSKIGTPEFVDEYWAMQNAVRQAQLQGKQEEAELMRDMGGRRPQPFQRRWRR
jgi:hypothetical protein